jgi:hypothetical protein
LEIVKMPDEATRLPLACVPARSRAPENRGVGVALILAIALAVAPGKLLAQHGGGGGRGMSAGGPNRPSGVGTKDDLQDFHRLVALQATPEQKAMFVRVLQDGQEASQQLKALRDRLQQPASADLPEGASHLDQAIEKAHTSNQGFVASFSPAQKSGLKDITKKLLKTDLNLARQTRDLSQAIQLAGAVNERALNSLAEIEKMLADFQSGQQLLAGEMSIALPSSAQDLVFTIPAVTNSIDMAGQTIAIVASTSLLRASGDDDRNFRFKLSADLSDVQREISGILQMQIDRSPPCGERLTIRRATLVPLGTAGLVRTQVHYERWLCAPGQGSGSPVELASGDGTIEIKVVPFVGPDSGLRLAPEIGHVEADGSLREMLSSGALGGVLRDQITATILSALQRGTDLKAGFPPAAQGLASLEKAQFQEQGGGRLSLDLEGRLQFSEEQGKQVAAQLKQRVSAQETSAP